MYAICMLYIHIWVWSSYFISAQKPHVASACLLRQCRYKRHHLFLFGSERKVCGERVGVDFPQISRGTRRPSRKRTPFCYVNRIPWAPPLPACSLWSSPPIPSLFLIVLLWAWLPVNIMECEGGRSGLHFPPVPCRLKTLGELLNLPGLKCPSYVIGLILQHWVLRTK